MTAQARREARTAGREAKCNGGEGPQVHEAARRIRAKAAGENLQRRAAARKAKNDRRPPMQHDQPGRISGTEQRATGSRAATTKQDQNNGHNCGPTIPQRAELCSAIYPCCQANQR